LAAIVATVIVATAAGIAAERRYGGRAGVATRKALIFVLYFVLPPVTFFNLAHVHFDANVGIGLLAAYAALALSVGIAWVGAAKVLRLQRKAVGAVLCCTLVANTGYLGYPLVASLLGLDSLSQAVVYDVLVSAPALLLGAFSVGAAFGDRAGEGPRERLRAFLTRNPALYAAIAGLLAPESLAPTLLVDISRIAIVAILPLGFFAVGAALAEEAEEGVLPLPPKLDAPVGLALVSRLVIAPGLLYLLALPFIDLPGPYLLMAAMPCGINGLIVTHAYGLDLRIVSSAVAWSTAIVVVVAAIAAVVT
jgi:malate permease and related proteins